MSSARVRRIGDTRDQLGESPVWDHRTQRLYWIDSLAGTIHRLDPTTGELTDFHAPAPIGSMVLRHDGGAMLALRHGFARYDFERGQVASPIASIDCDHSMVRLNDGKVDPFGRFIAGTLHGGRAHDEPALGGLYRLEAGAVTLLDTDLGVSNGPCFSPDGAILYLGDSARRVIWAYDYRREGPPANKRLFADTSTLNSGPDGATVDADGYLWSVLVRAGTLARFAPDGRLDRTVELPVKHPTSVAFGGPKLDILYMTSISKSTNLSASEPDAGGLFAIEGLGARGLAAYSFTAD
jgi:sugar lactone lactonase YvrE